MITPLRPYTVIDASAHMPNSVKSPYRHARIWRTDGAHAPTNVGTCKGGKSVGYSGNLHAGGKHRDAFHDWMDRAAAELKRLNDAHEIEMMTSLGCAPWHLEEVRRR